MIRGLTVALVLAAAPAFAQSDEEVDAMTTAVEAAGCVVTAENGDAVMEASGLSEEQTMAVIAKLYTDGLVALTPEGHMKLTNEVCP